MQFDRFASWVFLLPPASGTQSFSLLFATVVFVSGCGRAVAGVLALALVPHSGTAALVAAPRIYPPSGASRPPHYMPRRSTAASESKSPTCIARRPAAPCTRLSDLGAWSGGPELFS